MTYVNVQYAAAQLDRTVACLFRDTPKYRPFLKKSSEGKRDAGFALDAFRKAEETKETLLERTKLLTEYLYHIEGMTYTEMSEISGVGLQSVWQCSYGFDSAFKLALSIRNERPFHFERFHKYYGWEVRWLRR